MGSDADPELTIAIAIERKPYGELEAAVPAAPVTSVALHLTGRCTLEWKPDARPLIARPSRGAMTIVPRGRAGRLRVSGGASEVLKIGIPEGAFAAHAARGEQAWRGAPLLDRIGARDPLVEQLALTLLRETEQPGVVDTLYRDALTNALLAQLIKSHSAGEVAVAGGRTRYALSPSRARRCLDFMESHLTTTIGLDVIARELDMSVSHFSTQFTRSFGRSPARYLTWLRLERAREAIEGSRTPISEIAEIVGFCSVSHFSHAFRNQFGTTPTEWRARRDR